MVKHAAKPLHTRGGIKVYAYDTVDYLDSDEAVAGYLSASLTEDYEPDTFLSAIADALRAKGLNTLESLLKISEEMRPPAVSSAPVQPPAKKAARGKTSKKSAERKTSRRKTAAAEKTAHPKSRRRREVAVA